MKSKRESSSLWQNRILWCLFCLMLLGSGLQAQTEGVSINKTGDNPDNSAILDVQSNNQGLLMPRLTTAQRDAIENPAAGLIIYNLQDSCFNYYTGALWVKDCGSTQSGVTTSAEGQLSNSNTQTRLVENGPDNTIYLLGDFNNQITLGDISLSQAGNNAYLARYSPQTGEYLWATPIATGVTAFGIGAVSADGQGNLYITGGVFAGMELGGESLPASANTYVAKVNADGDVLWTYLLEGQVSIATIKSNEAGEVHFAGNYVGTADFGATSLTASGDSDIMVGKLNSDGSLAFVNGGYVTSGPAIPRDIELGPQGNIYLAGNFRGGLTFGPNTLEAPTGLFSGEGFLAAFDPTGNALWGQEFDSATRNEVFGLELDNAGNLYLGGNFTSSVEVGGTMVNVVNDRSSYLAKLDATGNAIWTQAFGGAIFPKLFGDGLGKIYVGGNFDGQLVFETQNLNSSNNGQNDAFITQFDSEGNQAWIARSTGTLAENLNDGVVTPAGNVFAVGYFRSNPATFGDIQLTPTAFFSGFLWPVNTQNGGEGTVNNLANSQDNDRDPTNELQDWTNLPGIPSGFADDIDNVDDADNDPTNELQDWSTLPGIPAAFADNTDDVNDADADPTNELQDWTTLPGIPADFADNTDDVNDADADPTNELQDWTTLPGIPADFADNMDDVNDADADPTNELQDWTTLPGIPADFADSTDDVNDADADPTNELQDWMTLPGIPADFADNTDDVNDADADPTNELQDWTTLPGIPAGFTDNTDDVNDADADPANEIQNLTEVLTQGNDGGGNGLNNLGDVEVIGNITMQDGNQMEGYVMTSDTNGVGSWQSLESLMASSLDSTVLSTCLNANVQGTLDLGNVTPKSMAVSGNYAYVLEGLGVNGVTGLMVIDVSNPANPIQLNLGPNVVGSGPISVPASDGYVYLLDGLVGLRVLDVSDPANIRLDGNLQIGSIPSSLVVTNNYAYALDQGTDDLKVIDVSNPASPSLVGSLGLGPNPFSVAVSNNYAYVVDRTIGDLKVINVSNPASPSLVGSLDVGFSPQSIAVSGDYAYVVEDGSYDLKVIDVSNPASPSLVGSIQIADEPTTTIGTGFDPRSVTVSGNFVYVANDGSSNLKVIDVSNPASPRLAGRLETDVAPFSVVVQDNYAYLTDIQNNHFTIVETSACNDLSVVYVNDTGILVNANTDDADADPTNELQDWNSLPGIPAGFSDNIDNVADADADPTNELQDISLNGNQLSITNGSTLTLPGSAAADNLGNHTATQNLQLNGSFLSGDGGNEGVFVAGNGNVGIGTNNPQHLLNLGGTVGRKLALFQNAQGTDFYGFAISGNTLELHAQSTATEDPLMVLNGFTSAVGIGTTNPTRAKLEIGGAINFDPGLIGFLNQAGATGSYDAPVFPYSIYASGVIAGQEFHAHSDERIKNILGTSDGEADLSTLMEIEVTDYRLRDSISKGDHTIKKVIAQQVAEVYPQAVSNDLTEVVPDIYQRTEMQDGWVQLATDLQVGERVKLITEQKSEVYEVIAVEAERFQVAGLEVASTTTQDVFVYGREVDDFHTVDYEAISMLNVSATQELAKQLERLKAENAAMQAENETMKAANAAFEARLERIEALLQDSSSVEYRSQMITDKK